MDFTLDSYRISVLAHIGESAGTWDSFNISTRLLQSKYLNGLEEAKPSDMEFRYVLIYKDDKLAACAYLQVVNFSELNFSGSKSSLLIMFLKLVFRMKKVRLMFCGNLFSVDYPCLSFNQTLIHFQDLVVILQRICETEKCQLLMLKEINSGDTVHKFLIANGFRKYGEDFTMKLDIPEAWESFEDYFRSLTKKYKIGRAHV